MKVINSPAVNAALRTLGEGEQEKVLSWFHRLENWEVDEHLRDMAKKTIYPNTYVLNTSDDFKIFFTLNEDANGIVIVDLAKPSRFQFTRVASE